MGLMSTFDTEVDVAGQTYAFMVILGLGFGMSLSSLIVVGRIRVQPHDSAVLLATLTQVRVLGGCIALAIASSLVASYTTAHLEGVLTQSEIAGVLSSVAEGIGALPKEKQGLVREVFGEAWALQQRVMLGVSGGAFVAALAMFSTEGKSLGEVKRDMVEWEKGGREAA